MPPVPVLVYDANHEALARRVTLTRDAAGARPVHGFTSSIALLLHAQASPPGTTVLVDLCLTDRFALDRPGERLIRRLARCPATAQVNPVAWSAHALPEVVRGARDAGAHGFVEATLDPANERAAVTRALDGDAVWPESAHDDAGTAASDDAYAAWFENHFRMSWEAWIEPMLVRLAAGVDRTLIGDQLVELGVVSSKGQASQRLRVLARAIAGENSNAAPEVARRAALALTQMAANRPLAERPVITVNLEQGAWILHRSPSLVCAAGLLPGEVDDIIELQRLISAKRASETPGAGAPPADRVSNERRWAAGRRALAYGAARDTIDEVIDGILVGMEEALWALEDARQDELYHPEARAAAALSLVSPAMAVRVPGCEARGARVTWRGLTADVLATTEGLPVGELRDLIATVDRVASGRDVADYAAA